RRPQGFKYLLQPLFLRGADEDDLTLVRFAHGVEVFDEKSPAFDYLAVKRSQCCPERIIAQHANRDSVAIAGPIDILDEVIQVGGFDFVIRRRETLCRGLMRDLEASVSDTEPRATPRH